MFGTDTIDGLTYEQYIVLVMFINYSTEQKIRAQKAADPKNKWMTSVEQAPLPDGATEDW